jgi:AbiV family abortive infection protein
MENVVSLIEDAAALLANDSPGRARSLVILAEEELSKAQLRRLGSW